MIHWRKSSHSGSEGGNCVELGYEDHEPIAIRDSKNPDGPTIRVNVSHLLSAVKDGKLS